MDKELLDHSMDINHELYSALSHVQFVDSFCNINIIYISYLTQNQQKKGGCFILHPPFVKATAGFEPAIRVLQTPALPLGHIAILGKAGGEIRTDDLLLGKETFYH